MATNVETRIRCEYDFNLYLTVPDILEMLGIPSDAEVEVSITRTLIPSTKVETTYLDDITIYSDQDGELADSVIAGLKALDEDGFGMAFQIDDNNSVKCYAWRKHNGKLREWGEVDPVGALDVVYNGIWKEAMPELFLAE